MFLSILFKFYFILSSKDCIFHKDHIFQLLGKKIFKEINNSRRKFWKKRKHVRKKKLKWLPRKVLLHVTFCWLIQCFVFFFFFFFFIYIYKFD
jgi:hypothetical protein